MDAAPLSALTAADASRKIREGMLTSEELVSACLERVRDVEPKVQAWTYQDGPDPNFTLGPIYSGSMVKDDCDQTRHNSLLLAVQIAPRLGYDRLLFIGVDLLDDGLAALSTQLQAWHPKALAMNIAWLNASPLSRLCEWMPYAQPSEMMQIREVAA